MRTGWLGGDSAAVTSTYDKVFDTPFPTQWLASAALRWEEHPEWHFHAHFYRAATFGNDTQVMVGFELLGGPQRDITPETAAEMLRAAAVKA